MNSKSRWLGITAIVAAVACVGLCALIGLSLRFAPDLYIWANRQGGLKVGSQAPDFSLTSLDGAEIRLSDLRGRPVVLSFGASWCPDCRAEAPLLQELHEGHPEMDVLMVDSNEELTIVRNYAAEFGMTHPVFLDRDGSVSDRYHIFAIPTEFFIDPQGIIRALLIESVTPNLLADYLPLIGVEP